jgi:UV DNA damage repair endonuclease
VFVRLGGTAAMADWARENPTEFYRIYSKLLPLQVAGENGPLEVVLRIAPHD